MCEIQRSSAQPSDLSHDITSLSQQKAPGPVGSIRQQTITTEHHSHFTANQAWSVHVGRGREVLHPGR